MKTEREIIQLAKDALGDGYTGVYSILDVCTECDSTEKSGHDEQCKIGKALKAIDDYLKTDK